MNYSAETYFAELTQLTTDVKAAYQRLNSLQSALDKEVSALYHDLERSDAIDSGEFVRKLKETLVRRRVVKDEMIRLSPVYNMLRNQYGTVEAQYERSVRTSSEVRTQLNSTLSITQVMEAIGS